MPTFRCYLKANIFEDFVRSITVENHHVTYEEKKINRQD